GNGCRRSVIDERQDCSHWNRYSPIVEEGEGSSGIDRDSVCYYLTDCKVPIQSDVKEAVRSKGHAIKESQCAWMRDAFAGREKGAVSGGVAADDDKTRDRARATQGTGENTHWTAACSRSIRVMRQE